MLSKFHLNSFKIYNIFLIFNFSFLINANTYIISSVLYCIFHFLIIYLGIYYYKKSLYILYFIYGILLDVFLMNEIGPHLISFILFLLFINFFIKYFYNLSSIKIYFLILILVLVIIFLEILISAVLYDYQYYFLNLINIILISLIMSFPMFLIFIKIDLYK